MSKTKEKQSVFYNKIAGEPYKGDRKIQANVVSGFASIKQRQNLVGLKVLGKSNVMLNGKNVEIEAGSTVFFKENDLYSAPWSKDVYTVNGVEMALLEPSFLVMVEK